MSEWHGIPVDDIELPEEEPSSPVDLLETVFDRAGWVVEIDHVNVEFDDDRWSQPVHEFRILDPEGQTIRLTAVYEDDGEETA